MVERKAHAKSLLKQILIAKNEAKVKGEELTSVTMCGYDISSLTVAEIPRIETVWDLGHKDGNNPFGKLLGLEVVLSNNLETGKIVIR